MPMKNRLLISALALLSIPVAGFAEDAAPATKTYSKLFVPVAIEDRRALSIDRSNFVYAPSGINSGVLQVEVSAVEYTQDDQIPGTDGQLKQFNFGATSIRMGVTDDFELQTIFTSHITSRFTDGTGAVTKDEGFGDTLFQARYTFAGNHGETVGVALMPYVKLPTNTLDSYNDKLEGGMQVPLSYAFNDVFSVCAAPGFDVNYNGQPDNAYDFNPFLGVAFWYTAVPDKVFLFNEWFIKKNTGVGKDDLNSYAGLGGTWTITRDFGVDFGVNIGLSEVASDLYTRVGLTYRF